jgi:Leucine-rich repeat (LRR) protein
MSKNLPTIKQNNALVLKRAKKLIGITNKILKINDDSKAWINTLFQWFKDNIIQKDTKLPIDKVELLKLQKLSLRWNRLSEIPVELCNLKQLKILELSNNNLSCLPREIDKLKNLEELNLNINNLKTLPKEVSNLEKLKVLNIKNNKYLELSEEQKKWLESLLANGCIIKYDKYKFNIGELNGIF